MKIASRSYGDDGVKLISFLVCMALLSCVPLTAQENLVISNVQLFVISDIEVPARETGVLQDLQVSTGDLVNEGDLIGMLDTDLAESELEVAALASKIAEVKARDNIDFEYATKSFEVSQSQLDLSRKANEIFENAVSQTELQKLSLEVERAALSMKQAERDFEEAILTSQLRSREKSLAAARLARRRIEAPFDGMIVKIFKQPKEWLNPGDSVVRIVQLSKLRAEIFVDAEIATRDLVGTSATFSVTTRQGAPQSVEGEVVFVDAEIQPVSNTVRVWVEFDNEAQSLRPGDKGKVVLLGSEAR